MARYVVTAIEVHPGTLFDSNGAVRRWMVGVTAEIKAASKAKAPPSRSRARWPRTSTGAMRASISGNTSRTGPTINVGRVSVNHPHARYVLRGTAYQGRRYIYSSEGWANKAFVDLIANRVSSGGRAGEGTEGLYMKLPLTTVGGRRRFHLRVHGQRANNFLIDGYNAVAHVHQALHPMANRYTF